MADNLRVGRGAPRSLRHDGLQRWLLEPSSAHGMVLRKVLEPTLALDGRLARSWLEHAEQNRGLAGCAQVLDSGRDADGVWITSAHEEGATLAHALRGDVPTSMAVYAAQAILRALEAGHARQLVHLDLDPHGVQVSPDGALSLPEFGLWSALTSAELVRVRFDAERVAYMAPELVRARAADARSDLFAVGWLLYEWLAGRAPFAGSSALELATAIDAGQRAPLARVAPRVPAALCDVVEMLLQTEPGARFQSAAAARGALTSVAPIDVAATRRELAARVGQQEVRTAEPRTQLSFQVREAVARPALRAPVLERVSAPASESALIAPPPLLMSHAGSRAPSVVQEKSQVRPPRVQAVQGEPVHDGRTAFLRVESALRSMLPRNLLKAARTSGGTSAGSAVLTGAPRAMPGKWRDPSSTLFRVRRAALAGPVVRVAAWPWFWWVALAVALGGPAVACLYLICRLWF